METTKLLTFLVNSLWQVPLVTAVASLAAWGMRRGPASHRHAVWAAALFAAVLLPLASLRTAARRVVPLHPPTALLVPAAGADAFPVPATPISPKPRSIAADPIMVPFAARTARILGMAYVGFLLLRLGLLWLAWMRTVRIRRAARRCGVSQPLESTWERCRRAFRPGRVELLTSATAPGPLMTGAWRRAVIVPDSLLAETSEDVLITALGHEMAHAKRHDFFLNVLCELLYIPISFNPVAWILRRGIERTREMACDEMVTSRLLDRGAYARSIVHLAAGMASPAHPGYTLGVFDGDILEERIRRLVEGRVANLRQARVLLAAGLSALIVCAIVASGLALSARAQSGARPEMQAGVQAFNSGDFQAAIGHFQAAVQLEPSNLLAKLHLANAFVAAAKGSEPRSMLSEARQQYEDVLSLDPVNPTAILGWVSLSNPSEFSHSRDLLKQLIAADPKNATAYYTLAVQDWVYAFPRIQQATKAAGIPPNQMYQPLPDPAARQALRDQLKTQLDEGIQSVQTALQLDPNSSESMAYLNLLFRAMAVIADTPAQSKDLVAKADDLVGQAIAAKRAAARKAATVLPLDADSPPPLTSSIVPAPPPPPPPPPRPVQK